MPMTVVEIIRRHKDRLDSQKTDLAQVLSGLIGDARGTIHQTISAFVPRTAEELIDEWFPWARDQRIAMDPNVPEVDRMAAARRLASTVLWNPYSSWTGGERQRSQELHARAAVEGRSTKQVIEEILIEAVMLVLGDRERVRRIDVGSGPGSYSLRETESVRPGVSPARLPYSADPKNADSTSTRFNTSPYLYWFQREVQKAATAILLDEPYPPTDTANDLWGLDRSNIDLDQMQVEDPDADPLLQILESEHYAEQTRRLLHAIEQVSPQQRDILRHLADGNSIAQAARDLGIAESTARVQVKRVRDKATAM
jgi:DNA-binding CsgD family transcriptional regulator